MDEDILTTAQLEHALREAIYAANADEEFPDSAVQTFAEADLMTTSAGLVIRFETGAEFQLTIVQTN